LGLWRQKKCKQTLKTRFLLYTPLKTQQLIDFYHVKLG
jgi:hypothetical protein